MPNIARLRFLRPRPLVTCLAAALGLRVAAATPSTESMWPIVTEPMQRSARPMTPAHPNVGPTVIVGNCDDNGTGSLRSVYASAVDGETIDLSQLPCSLITLTTGALIDPPAASTVTLIGPGRDALAIDGGGHGRVLVHNGSGTLTASGMTIRNGSYSGDAGGGCVYAANTLIFTDVAVSACSVTGTGNQRALGGGIYALGTAAVFDSTVSGCTAHANAGDSAGGGVWASGVSLLRTTVSGNTVSGDGTHTSRGGGVFALNDVQVNSSTVSGNQAESGGGLFLAGNLSSWGYEFIANSTVSGNSATGAGGGVFSRVPFLKILNSTIASNRGDAIFGGGLYFSTDITLQSTIIANNTAPDGLSNGDVGGAAAASVAGANNLVVVATHSLPADTLTADPQLGPLQDNGGRTQTHALALTSPAIDTGNNIGYFGPFNNDQRSIICHNGVFTAYERVVGARADIGAFESGAPDRIFASGFDTGSPCAD